MASHQEARLSATMRGVKDARLAGELFSRTKQTGICSPEAFELGFPPVLDELDVFSLHISATVPLVAIMLKRTGVDSELLGRLASRAVGDDAKLLLELLL